MVIVIQCTDQVGLVASITAVLAKAQLNIVSMREYVDEVNNQFFMRLEVNEAGDTALIEANLRAVLPRGAAVHINPLPDKEAVILVTKEHHCLADILVRNFYGTLGAKVNAVIGNYDVLGDICRRFEIPFYHISHENTSKEEFEEQLLRVIHKHTPDYLVLAKFMRILSPAFVGRFPQRIINIHHSFLPAFIGANPYKKAYERGVKLIGATAHFVSSDLDEGPIIAQQIIPVNHSFSAASMMKAGREIETAVLANALKLVFEDRVFVFANKTIVFD